MIPLRLVLENFISHVKSELDFTKFDAALLVGAHSGNPYVSNGVGKCIPGDSILYNKHGSPIQMECVVKDKIDSILGFSNNRVTPVRVKNWFKLGEKKTVTITLQSGSSLTAAITHPILTPNGCVTVDKLKVGQWIGEIRRLPCTHENYSVSSDEALLLGLLLGDGTVTKYARFTNNDDEVVRLYKSLMHKIFPGIEIKRHGINYSVVNQPNRKNIIKQLAKYLTDNNVDIKFYFGANCSRFVRGECASFEIIEQIENDLGIDLWSFKCKLYGSRIFLNWLKSMQIFGQTSVNKGLPHSMWALSEQSTINILRGLWLTDGYISSTKRNGIEVSFSSTSASLCKMVRYMLLRLGIVSKIKKKRIGYTISLNCDQILNFDRKIKLVGTKQTKLDSIVKRLNTRSRNPNRDLIPNFLYRRYSSKLKTYTESTSRQKYFSVCSKKEKDFTSEIFWNKIVSIENCGFKECFDIEVDTPEHLYIADTFIVHNSAIFDGMRWALFNKSRFSTKDKVVKRGKPFCKVIFEFMIDNEKYRIIRKLNKCSNLTDVNFFKKVGDKWEDDGLTCDTPTMTNRKIIEIIRMSDDTFVNSIYFKQNDISGFASATTAKRKETLKEVLQIGIWDEFQQVAKNNIKRFEDQRIVLEERLRIIGDVDVLRKENKEKISDLESQMEGSKKGLEVLEEEVDGQRQIVNSLETIIAQKGGFNLSELKEEKKNLSSMANEIKKKRKELSQRMKENNDIIANETCDDLEGQLLRLSERILKTSRIGAKKAKEVFVQYSEEEPPSSQYSQAGLDRKKEQLRSHRDALNALNQDLINLNSVRPGKECPICLSQIKNPKDIARRRRERKKFLLSQIEEGEVVINDLSTSIKKEQNAIERAKEAMIELERTELALSRKKAKITDARNRNAVIEIELRNLRASWEKLKDEYNKIKAVVDNVKEDEDIHIKLEKAKAKHTKLFDNLEGSRRAFLELSVQHGMLQGYGEELERRKSERNVVDKQLSKILKEIEVYKNLAKAFGKDGIQAIIMENITEDLRKYANSVLKQVCSDPMSIDFVTQKQTGSGSWKEQFDIKISVGSSELDFDDLSGGEQVRISIALRLALSQLLMRRVGSNVKFLLLDEVDQALDRHGIDALSSAILSLSKNLKILVITHNEAMKEKFENIITIQKGASGSVLKQ